MKFYIGITDDDWFHFLAQHKPDEVNFWRPRDKSDFKVIQESAPFLFKLHLPNNYIEFIFETDVIKRTQTQHHDQPNCPSATIQKTRHPMDQ